MQINTHSLPAHVQFDAPPGFLQPVEQDFGAAITSP